MLIRLFSYFLSAWRVLWLTPGWSLGSMTVASGRPGVLALRLGAPTCCKWTMAFFCSFAGSEPHINPILVIRLSVATDVWNSAGFVSEKDKQSNEMAEKGLQLQIWHENSLTGNGRKELGVKVQYILGEQQKVPDSLWLWFRLRVVPITGRVNSRLRSMKLRW